MNKEKRVTRMRVLFFPALRFMRRFLPHSPSSLFLSSSILTHSFSVLSLFSRRSFFFQLHHQPSSPKSWELRDERGSKGRIRIKNSHSCFTRGKRKRREEKEGKLKKRERRMQGKQRTKKNLSFLPSSKNRCFMNLTQLVFPSHFHFLLPLSSLVTDSHSTLFS